MIITPDVRNGAAVIYHHGVGETETAIAVDPQKRPLVCALVSAGYVVAGSNAHGDNWGNDAALDDYAALADHLAADRVMVWSQSMGGLSGLLSIADGRTANVAAWAGIYPLTNLEAARSQAGTDFPVRIAAAYSRASTDGHNPVELDAALLDVPMLAWASPEDTIVPKTQHVDLLAAVVEVEVVMTRGEHGDESNFDAARLVAFFDSYNA